MKFSRSAFEMQRFESRAPTGQSVSNAYGIGVALADDETDPAWCAIGSANLL
jgi:hypothetical protein